MSINLEDPKQMAEDDAESIGSYDSQDSFINSDCEFSATQPVHNNNAWTPVVDKPTFAEIVKKSVKDAQKATNRVELQAAMKDFDDVMDDIISSDDKAAADAAWTVVANIRKVTSAHKKKRRWADYLVDEDKENKK